MFVQYYGLVERPLAEVEVALLSLHAGLADSATFAYRHGEGLVTKIGGGGVAKKVLLDLGTPVRAEGSIAQPLVWWATGTPGLFPTMDAELVVTSLGEDLTQVTFQGTYKPPLGPVGKLIDKALLHHFAEVSVKDFVDRVVTLLRTA
jgi:hypothetical protein